MFALSAQSALDLFVAGIITALGAAAVASMFRLARFMRHQNKTLAELEHRQQLVIRWARKVAQRLAIHFPPDDDDDVEVHGHIDKEED